MNRTRVLLLAAALLLSLTGCRSRTTTAVDPDPVVSAESESEQTVQDKTKTPEHVENAQQQISDPASSSPQLALDAPTGEDPASDRKVFSAEADAEIAPDAETPVVTPEAEKTAQPVAATVPAPDESLMKEGGSMETDDATQTVTETVPADTAEDLGTAEDGSVADTVLLYYQTLLSDRLGSLFECQKLSVYWETSVDYTTVFKTSAEHQLIQDAGAYDVSVKVLEENLKIDDGWIQRKNPGMVVKVVGPEILGSNIQSTNLAKTVADALLAREGWSVLDAAKNGKILILSDALLTSQAKRTAAAVYLAKAMYPSLLEDVDADEALRLLTEEASGSAENGVFAYLE